MVKFFDNKYIKVIIFFLIAGILSAIVCSIDPFNILEHSEEKKSEEIKNGTRNVDNEFREYFKKTYNQELTLNYNVEVCYDKSVCDYSGEYFLKNDKSYRVEIIKKDGKYKDSYNDKAMAIRQELVDYINEVKGGNMALDYLVFYDNGQEGYTSSDSVSTELKYIVYDSSSELTEEKLQGDYNILKKANEILKKYNSSGEIREMEVTYVTNQDVKTEDWANKICNEINSESYTNLGYCFNKKDINDISHYDCNYVLEDDYNNLGLSYMTYDQFKQKALESYNNLK